MHLTYDHTMDNTWLLGSAAVALLVILFYNYFIKIYDYWQKRGIPSVNNPIPFFGNALSVITFRKNFACHCDEIYEAHRNRSMVGFFQFRNPALLIREPDLVKTVLVSGFSNFHTNGFVVDPELDPLLAGNPFFTDGEEWKIRRARLTNALMSSKKLKVLSGSVITVCSKFTDYLEDNVRKSNGAYEAEMKDMFSRFTGEVVASGGFGAEGDFFSNGSGPNSFRELMTETFEPTLKNAIALTLLFALPGLSRVFGLSFIPKRLDRFFRSVMSNMIALRKKDGIVRNDFLQIMLDNHKIEGGEVDEDAIAASATSFFVDGYETSAITLGFFAYQVAANPHVQDKLRFEVNAVLDKYDGELSYEALNEMTYMDQALNESIRLYPAIGFLSKRCSQRCKIVGKDGLECLVEPGTEIIIPIQALQRDPEYWENPDSYDPERFSAANKNDRPKTVFLPFSEGPRICPGMRFATMQIKAAMTTILRRFSMEVSPKTKEPLKLSGSSTLSAVDGGTWIIIKKL